MPKTSLIHSADVIRLFQGFPMFEEFTDFSAAARKGPLLMPKGRRFPFPDAMVTFESRSTKNRLADWYSKKRPWIDPTRDLKVCVFFNADIDSKVDFGETLERLNSTFCLTMPVKTRLVTFFEITKFDAAMHTARLRGQVSEYRRVAEVLSDRANIQNKEKCDVVLLRYDDGIFEDLAPVNNTIHHSRAPEAKSHDKKWLQTQGFRFGSFAKEQ